MITNNYLLKLSDRIICSSESKVVLSKLIKKLKKLESTKCIHCGKCKEKCPRKIIE